jgi:hypothetical protein
MEKHPFDIDMALERIEQAVQPWPKAALFQLARKAIPRLRATARLHHLDPHL